RPEGPALLFRSRVLIALLSVALGAAVFATARRVAGDGAGLAALGLYAPDPLVLAHAGFATTDLGGAALYFLATVALASALARADRGARARRGARGEVLAAPAPRGRRGARALDPASLGGGRKRASPPCRGHRGPRGVGRRRVLRARGARDVRSRARDAPPPRRG